LTRPPIKQQCTSYLDRKQVKPSTKRSYDCELKVHILPALGAMRISIRFREALSPIVIRMEFRLAELENPARQHGIRLGQVASRQNAINELKRASIVMRAESYRRRLCSEFDRAKEIFLP
jgi:hypothetical protein